MSKTVQCRFCTEPFEPRPGKPGRINVCYDPVCQSKDRKQAPEPDKLMAKVAWEGKHTPVIEVTANRAQAMIFNAMQRRHGASVIRGFGNTEYAYAGQFTPAERSGNE